MKRFFLGLAVLSGVVLAAWLFRPDHDDSLFLPSALPGSFDDAMQALRPLPELPPLRPERVALGARLFADTRLSADYSVACISCHRFDLGGADGLPVSVGILGREGGINAPSVFNSSLNFVQFWDGRALTLQEQAAGPIHNPLEMGASWSLVIERLGADETMREAFRLAYPDGLTAASIADAIASFEQSLLTPDSPFDRYLRGDEAALDELARTGYQRFRDFGCISCHQGVLLGGNMFQKFGVLGDYFADRTPTEADLGRYNVTGREEDRHVFKVPGLRNVALTAPYFHDGSAPTLEMAVAIMGRYQLGRDLAAEDVKAIVAFLNSLTGRIPATGRDE
ncbi:cytochrome c peroxidase [uncultured Azonexus sp.]|uniref:cytochrome-c peroxidase n=1 Tax=uncultured Azonexus sp. TaxID=520307 RepID=UPI00261B8957|nr:cytochrome c peroxidase [uncultured Azonexus sp.]